MAEWNEPYDETQFVWLPGLESSWLEGRWSQIGYGPNGEHLVRRIDGDDVGLYVIDAPGGAPRFVHHSTYLRADGRDPVAIDDYDAYPDSSWERPLPIDRLHWIVAAPLGGGEPNVVIRDVYHPLRLTDDRWATVRDFAFDDIGELRIIDEAGGPPAVLDTDVFSEFARHWPWAWDGSHPMAGPPNNEILYSVHDPSEDRMGLWFARVAEER